MNTATIKLLTWTPRVLGVLFILFVSMFSLDVFAEGYTPLETAIAFLMHNLPSFVMLVALLLAWYKKWEWAGAIGYLGFAVWYFSFASAAPLG